MTIDTSRFELRLHSPDGLHYYIGVWDKQTERFRSERHYTIQAAEVALRAIIKENTPKLAYKKLTETIQWQQICRWDHSKEKFFFVPELNQSYPYKTIQDIPIANGAIVEITQLVKTQYRCEFEKE